MFEIKFMLALAIYFESTDKLPVSWYPSSIIKGRTMQREVPIYTSLGWAEPAGLRSRPGHC